MIEALKNDLLLLGFTGVQIEELDDEEKTKTEEIWVKVRFNWKWNGHPELHNDGRQEFFTSYNYAIHDVMAFVSTRESWKALLKGPKDI